MKGRAFPTLFFFSLVLKGFSHKICVKRTSFCDHIFVFKTEDKGFVSLLDVPFNWNSSSLQGRTIRVLADNMLPYIASSRHSEDLDGYLGDVWRIIQEALKFKTKVSSVSYDKGLKLLEASQADVLLAAAISKRNLSKVVFSQPYLYNWYDLFIKSPEAKASSSSYLRTFNTKLWISSLVVFLVLTLTLWTTNFLLKTQDKPKKISIPSCFLGIISGFINQGYDLRLTSFSARILVFFALIFGLVLYSALNAVLVAQLAIFETPFPFKSLQDVMVKKTHSLCLRSNSFVHNNFTNELKEVLPQWKNVLNGNACGDINNQTQLISILCKESLLVLENRIVMGRILNNFKLDCYVISLNKKLFSRGNSFVMLKAFRGRRVIDTFLKKMRESGVLQHLEFKWIQSSYMNVEITKSPQATMDHVRGILLVYFFAILLSFLVLFFEMVLARTYQKKAPRTFQHRSCLESGMKGPSRTPWYGL